MAQSVQRLVHGRYHQRIVAKFAEEQKNLLLNDQSGSEVHPSLYSIDIGGYCLYLCPTWWLRNTAQYSPLSTVRSESRCALRLRYVDLVVSSEVAVEVCC
jgi:hypothetical protein